MSDRPVVPGVMVTDGVTPREAEVLALLGERLRNDEIASRLHLSVRTVESHVSSLLRKLQAADRRDLARHVGVAGTGVGPGKRRERSALPRLLSSFIGRDADLQQVRTLLGEHTLVTITGPAGAGKTRLALAVAEDHPAAVFVDLLGQPRGGDVQRAFADALDVDAGAPGLTAAVREALSDPDLLVVVDNCEHVLAAAAGFLAEMLSTLRCRVLITGREPLALPGEVVHGLGPLSSDEALRLFHERAAAALPTYSPEPGDAQTAAQICARLDGLPLAIELAAARVRVFAPAELLTRLEEGLAVLSGGPPGHHATLEAALAWSHDLLSETEQLVLERCAVFPGPFGYDDAAAVVGHPPLDATEFARAFPRLLDRSLVSARRERVTSYHLLDSVRSFAGARLEERAEASELRERHARRFVAEGTRHAAGLRGAGQDEAIAWYAGHWADLRAAAAWGVAHEPTLVGHLVGGVGTGWEVHGARAELFEWLDAAGEGALAVGAAELAGIAVLLGYADVDRAVRVAERASRLATTPEERALARLATGWALAYRGEPAAAHEQLAPATEAFAELGDAWHRALAQAVDATVLPDAREAIAGLQDAADAFGALGDRIKRANCLNLMGNRAIELGVARDEAHAWLAEASGLALAAGNEHEWMHAALFSVRLRLAELDDTSEVATPDSLATMASQLPGLQVGFQRLGDRRCVARCLLARGQVALLRREEAEAWLRQALDESRRVGDARVAARATDLLGAAHAVDPGHPGTPQPQR